MVPCIRENVRAAAASGNASDASGYESVVSSSSTRKSGPIARLKKWGHEVRALPPGSRFETLHERHTEGKHGVAMRCVGVVAGVGLVLVGLVQLVVPGPGMLFIVLGAALLAREFHVIAVAMDTAELRIRAIVKWIVAAWRGASTLAKAAVVGFAAAGVGAAAWIVVLLVRPGG
jgi:hypothetical protein